MSGISALSRAPWPIQETLVPFASSPPKANHEPAPQYTVIETLGPPHHRTFHVELKWNGGSARGEGRTIKAAEAAAAHIALQQMESK